jgi:hypothetical protein
LNRLIHDDVGLRLRRYIQQHLPQIGFDENIRNRRLRFKPFVLFFGEIEILPFYFARFDRFESLNLLSSERRHRLGGKSAGRQFRRDIRRGGRER